MGEYATESETMAAINETFSQYNYTVDPHTAVGIKSYQKYLNQFEDKTLTVIDSTANPYKFGKAVLESLTEEVEQEDEFRLLHQLKNLTGMEIHRALQGLEDEPVRHKRNCKSSEIKKELKDILGIKQ